MKKLLLCLLLAATSVAATSQKVYFIYLQSESEQPFFVKVNEKVFSSSASGYLILSKLVDSTYNFSLGFPQNKWPEQKFAVSVNRKDHGFLVKNFGEKGWGLFDLQKLVVQMSSAASAKVESPVQTENKDVSAFTDILSKAADDPSLRDKPVQPKVEEKKPEPAIQEIVKKEEIKADTKELPVTKPAEIVQQPVVKKEESKTEIKEPAVKPAETLQMPTIKIDSTMGEAKLEKDSVFIKPVESPPSVSKNEEIKSEIKEVPGAKTEEVAAVVEEEYKKSSVTKRSESSTTEGFGLVFTDDYGNGIKDTIRILIPNPKPVAAIIKQEPKEEKKFLDIPVAVPIKEEEKKVTEPLISKSLSNTKCAEAASESDFFKLRKTMAAAEEDDEMISEARKYFKSKCFTVDQIKNLSTLFLNDNGKYKFFDAAYLYTSDAANFSSLQTELKDEYYTNRFKAMLRN